MTTSIPLRSERLATYFLINLLAAIVGSRLLTIFGAPWDQVGIFLAAYLVLGAIDRSYLRALFWGFVFMIYLVYEIIHSNIIIAWLIIQPRPKLDPGIIGVPLRLRSGFEITMLASAITLTPGTISVDLGKDGEGRDVLFVHNLTVRDPAAFRQSVHDGFESLILRITRGA